MPVERRYYLREAVGLGDCSDGDRVVDVDSSGVERLAVEFKQRRILDFRFQHFAWRLPDDRHSVSSSSAPMKTMFATLAEPSLSAISEAGMQTTCACGTRESLRADCRARR